MRFAKLIESKTNNWPYGLVYSNGKIYAAGTIGNTGKRIGYDATFSSANHSSFLAKFDTSGQYEWTRFVGADNAVTKTETGGPATLAVDGQGHIHHYTYMGNGVEIMPSVISQTGNYDLKYDVNGNLFQL